MESKDTLNFYNKSNISIDPRTKIFLTITVSSILIGGAVGNIMNIIRPSLAILPFVLFLFVKRYNIAFKYILVYICLFVLEVFVAPFVKGTFGFILLGIIGVFSHMLPGFIMGYFLISTTTVSEFVAAMEKIKMSKKIIIPVSVIFRFFPTIKEEYVAIKDAMQMREVISLKTPFRTIEYMIVPLIMSIVKIGEELSAAALTRGLGGDDKRTNICNIGFSFIDIVLIIIAFICWIAFIFV